MYYLYFQYIKQPTNLAQLSHSFAELGPARPQLVFNFFLNLQFFSQFFFQNLLNSIEIFKYFPNFQMSVFKFNLQITIEFCLLLLKPCAFSKTLLGSTHEAERLLFSLPPLIKTFVVELILGSY